MSFIGVVLSGGQSRRMGVDKAQLNAFGKSMLHRTHDALLEAGAKKVVFSRNTDDANSIADIFPKYGPLSGIHAVCSHFLDENLLFVPVDLPLLTGADLRLLAHAGDKNTSLVRFERHNLPLLVKSSLPLVDALTRNIMQKQLSVGHFCRQFPLIELPKPDNRSLFNSNTKEQWLFALSALQAGRNRPCNKINVDKQQLVSANIEGIS